MRLHGGGHPSTASDVERTLSRSLSAVRTDSGIKTENVRPLASQASVVVVLELEVGYLGLYHNLREPPNVAQTLLKRYPACIHAFI